MEKPKKKKAKEQDKFIVRLPEGMRDRIRARAERAGYSMNEAIVYALERFFPAPVTLDQRVAELASLVALLRQDDLASGVDTLIDAVDATLRDVKDNRIKVEAGFKELVQRQIEEWDESRAELYYEDNHNPFDDANYPDIRTGDPGWQPDPDGEPFPDARKED